MKEATTGNDVAKAFMKPEQDRAFFQGDRAPEGPIAEIATQLGRLLKERGWEANVGAYGGFVERVEDSGIAVHPHTMASDKAIKFNEQISQAVDAVALAKQVIGDDASPEKLKEAAWGIRMALFLATSEGFIFFPGTRGTRAHLLSAIAFNMVTDKPKPIALVGWESGQPNLIVASEGGLPDQEEAWLKTFSDEFTRQKPHWFKTFEASQVQEVIDFVTARNKHETMGKSDE